MGWHIKSVYSPHLDTNVDMYIDEQGDEVIQTDFWNPDIDMADAWMLIDKIRDMGASDIQVFEGFLSLLLNKDKPEFSMRISVFDLTPAAIAEAVHLLIKSK